jgi:protease-4
MRFLSTLAASVLGTLIALVALFLLLLFFFFALSLSASQTPQVQPGSVLVLPIDGPLPERVANDPFAQAFAEAPQYDLRDVQTALRNAARDDRIQGVWLRIKGTSAGWGTLEDVRAALLAFRERSGKPVYASSADFGMREREYFLASAADSVFAAPVSSFEWNGFASTQLFFADALDRLDIEPKIVRVGEFKSAVEPFLRSDLSEENRMQLNALLENQNERLKTVVAKQRGIDAALLESLADESAVLDAEGALDAGLLDALYYDHEVLDLFREGAAFTPGQSVPQVDVSDYAQVPASEANVSFTGSGNVAVVYAEGGIVSGDTEDPFGNSSQSIGSETFIDAMASARTSSSAKAVVVRINSPGGSASASEVMWHAVERTAQEKPVIVSMGDVAASGGYYIAAGADSILAQPTTITGSIGIYGILFNARAFFEDRLGVTFDQVSTSPLADLTSVVEPFSDREQRLLEQTLDRKYETFLQRVADGRGMDVEAVDDVARGRVWAGQDALAAGLVDRLGGLDEAIAVAGKAGGLGDGPYRTRILPRPKTFFEALNSEFSSQAARAWMRWTASDWEQRMWSQFRGLRSVLEHQGTAQARLPFSIEIN